MDFFSALLHSEFSTAPALKPRLPALFEPVAPRLQVPLVEEVSETQSEETPRAEIQNKQRPIPTSESPDTQRQSPAYRGRMIIPPSPHVIKEPESNSVMHQERQSFEPSSAQSDPEQAPPTRSSDNESPHPRTLRGQDATTQSIVPSIRPALPLEAETSRQGAASEPQPQSAPAAAPVVRISIGRIIVRAVSQTPPAPQKRESKSKKLSLDEYLNKGERGEQ